MKEGLARIDSSPNDIEEFKRNITWQDMTRELDVWASDLAQIYDTLKPTDEDFVLEFGKVQGRRDALKYFLELPDVILTALRVEEGEDEDSRFHYRHWRSAVRRGVGAVVQRFLRQGRGRADDRDRFSRRGRRRVRCSV